MSVNTIEGAEQNQRNPISQPMEGTADEENGITEPLLVEDPGKGGFKAIPTILAIEAVEQVGSYGLPPNMILYLTNNYHLEVITGNTIIYVWQAANGFMPVVGAFIADSYVGRFLTIATGSAFSILGMVALWLTAMIPEARPPPCNGSKNTCSSATAFQLFIICASFGLMSIGTGGIRSSALAFGADQLKQREGQRKTRTLERFFSLYYGLSAISIFVALSGIVAIQDKMGWKIGFGVPAVLMLVAATVFLLASPLYLKLKVKSSLLTGLFQVAVAAFKKRHIRLSSEASNILYYHNKDSALTRPIEKLRFLNKACIIIDPQQELTADGTAKDPWTLCTTDQVEELKTLLKVIPLWSTGMMMFVCINQASITVLQAKTMIRKVGGFQIPAGSFGTFTMIGVVAWVFLYYRVILRVASKLMGKPARVSAKNRMGLGVLASFLAMIAAAIVETTRRRIAIKGGHSDEPNAVVDMSALWLIPQLALIGIAEAFNAIAQNQFYYSEFPRSMSSIAATLSLLGIAFANLIASLIQNIINEATKKGGKQSWISTNINEGHYDYYYWILAVIALVNTIYFLVCSMIYGPSKEDMKETHDGQEGRRSMMLM